MLLGDLAVEADRVRHIKPRDLPRVAVVEPVVGELGLVPIDDVLTSGGGVCKGRGNTMRSENQGECQSCVHL